MLIFLGLLSKKPISAASEVIAADGGTQCCSGDTSERQVDEDLLDCFLLILL